MPPYGDRTMLTAYWLVVMIPSVFGIWTPIEKYPDRAMCEEARKDLRDVKSELSLALRTDAPPRYECLPVPPKEKRQVIAE